MFDKLNYIKEFFIQGLGVVGKVLAKKWWGLKLTQPPHTCQVGMAATCAPSPWEAEPGIPPACGLVRSWFRWRL